MSEGFQNQDLYRELSKPFESIEEANKACQAFQDELYELRKKYRLRDLVFVIQSAVKYEDGEGAPIVVGMFGDESKMESMTGYAYGRASAMRQERISEIVEEACKAMRAPKNRK